ncbi:hypothetical protein ETS23_06395 [Vibrio parahaemolyticus]|jgi:hypothetical protein|nr:hypothetical protein [Vibrio parahaemolyticus]
MKAKLDELVNKVIDSNESKFADDDQLIATVDGYEFEIYRDDNEDWYIQVNPEGEGKLYDGWWSDSCDKTLEEAVREAIVGACILGLCV